MEGLAQKLIQILREENVPVQSVHRISDVTWKCVLEDESAIHLSWGEDELWARNSQGEVWCLPYPEVDEELKSPDISSGPLRAPAAGKVTAVLVRKGEKVSSDQVLLKIESMKMELEVVATEAGTVTEIAEAGAIVRFRDVVVRF